jgi:hypothetical protein
MAVEVKKIEYIEGDCLVASHLEGILKRREIGDSLAVLDDHFAVEDSLFDRESGDGICHEREPISPIETSASPYDRLALFKNGLQAVAIEFDLMHKARSGRWRGGRSRQTRRDKAADPGGARGFRKSDPERLHGVIAGQRRAGTLSRRQRIRRAGRFGSLATRPFASRGVIGDALDWLAAEDRIRHFIQNYRVCSWPSRQPIVAALSRVRMHAHEVPIAAEFLTAN